MSCGKKNISFWGQRRIVPLPAEVHNTQPRGDHSDLLMKKQDFDDDDDDDDDYDDDMMLLLLLVLLLVVVVLVIMRVMMVVKMIPRARLLLLRVGSQLQIDDHHYRLCPSWHTHTQSSLPWRMVFAASSNDCKALQELNSISLLYNISIIKPYLIYPPTPR